MEDKVGPYQLNRVCKGDCLKLIRELPDESIEIVVTSPPYWGQRVSYGIGTEEDPRDYLFFLQKAFSSLLGKLKSSGIVWINIGDAYNTPVNWKFEDRKYSSLGAEQNGLSEFNTAYIKPRANRKAFIDSSVKWLQYGNLLALPYRLIISLCDEGYFFRGEVVWGKKNAMPEGRCRRPHRHHESIYLLTKNEQHNFKIKPPVKSVWEFPNEKVKGVAHYSRFPEELPRLCIDAYGRYGQDVVVLDPFSGSGTTGIAAIKMDCSFIGFEIDPVHVEASNERLHRLENEYKPLFTLTSNSSER